jgi:hypothetical protein
VVAETRELTFSKTSLKRKKTKMVSMSAKTAIQESTKEECQHQKTRTREVETQTNQWHRIELR